MVNGVDNQRYHAQAYCGRNRLAQDLVGQQPTCICNGE